MKLEKLRDESLVRKIADFEYEKGCIADILENVDEARVQFEVCAFPAVLRDPHSSCCSWPSVSDRSRFCMRSKNNSGFGIHHSPSDFELIHHRNRSSKILNLPKSPITSTTWKARRPYSSVARSAHLALAFVYWTTLSNGSRTLRLKARRYIGSSAT